MSIRYGGRFAGVMTWLLVQAATPVGAAPLSPKGSSTDEHFFPLAVWLQSPRNAERYKELGINTYVALWRGPTDEQLGALDKAGLHVICGQNGSALKFRDRDTIIGWMHGDEPDNAQSLGRGKGYGPPIAPEKVVEDYQQIKAADPDRPVLLNLGQGVAFDNYIGRGVRRNHPEDYPRYLEACDIASFDIYPVVHDHPEVAGKLWHVGRGVQRLAEWTGGKKPVWCCIETTHIDNPQKMPTPSQVRSEVWMAIVHGATGIIYFCHEFKPHQLEAGLLEYPEMARGVKAVNEQIKELAPVINSQTIKDGVRVASAEPEVPVAAMCKRHGGAVYVFAVSMREAPTTASFTIPGATANSIVEVLGEGRTIDGKAGTFPDKFDGYAVHLYRVGG